MSKRQKVFFFQLLFGLFVYLNTVDENAGMLVKPMSLPFEDCGSIYDLISIYSSSCTGLPCRMPKDQVVNMTVDFRIRAKLNLPKLVHEAYWIINEIPVRATTLPTECQGTTCHTNTLENGMIRFSAQLHVTPTLPSLRGTLHWKLLDDNGTTMMCYKIPVTITTS